MPDNNYYKAKFVTNKNNTWDLSIRDPKQDVPLTTLKNSFSSIISSNTLVIYDKDNLIERPIEAKTLELISISKNVLSIV